MGAARVTADTSTGRGVAIFGLANPAAGPQTVSITFSSAAYSTCQSITVLGGDTTTVFSNTVGTTPTQTGQPASVTCTSANGEFVIDGIFDTNGSTSPTADVSQGNVWTATPNFVHSGSTKPSTSASTTMSWTKGTAGTEYAQAAVSFKANTGATNQLFLIKA